MDINFEIKKSTHEIAGCWYYNLLSRKTLEKAGMITTSRGFDAELIEKEYIPLRTGNPPGELV